MTTEATATARRNTRLTPEREMELYTAVVDLLREVGYEALTMDAVATRTRSSKATLYRQWKGKPELVATALRACKPVRAEEVDTGSIVTDLYELAKDIPKHQDQDATGVMRALAHAAAHNPDLGNALREALIEPEVAALRGMLDRAVDRGEIPQGRPAVDYMIFMMTGAFFGRPLIEDRAVDAEFLTRYIDAVVLPALGVTVPPVSR
ncbi:TetR/AcrR family transcriptional regulator [Streptomyces sp. NBC_01537]|uniref:TetR/AcrR family transcriptional regulator n=1 Tax=Streptomyces sp. NBC_01537 TaxID=2903896 RepID=UPI003868FEC8